MTKTWDVAIAGGGIIGGAIAFELARRGVSVIVLEKQSPGNEASWAAAGMLSPTPHTAHDIPLLPLMAASAAIYPEFVAAVESTSGERACFQQIGAMEALFATDAEREMNTLLALHHGLGLQTDALPLAQAFELEPSLSRNARAVALRDSEACVDNRAFTSAVLRAATASDAEFRTDSPVEEIVLTNDRCAGVIAGGEKISARNVVIAAGCYSAQIDGAARYAPVRPVRGQMVAMRSDHVDLKHVLRSEKCYIVPRGNGICIAGSTLENVGFVKRVTPDGIAKILNARARDGSWFGGCGSDRDVERIAAGYSRSFAIAWNNGHRRVDHRDGTLSKWNSADADYGAAGGSVDYRRANCDCLRCV